MSLALGRPESLAAFVSRFETLSGIRALTVIVFSFIGISSGRLNPELASRPFGIRHDRTCDLDVNTYRLRIQYVIVLNRVLPLKGLTLLGISSIPYICTVYENFSHQAAILLHRRAFVRKPRQHPHRREMSTEKGIS